MLTLSEGGYEMLRAAVNAARQFQCRNVNALKVGYTEVLVQGNHLHHHFWRYRIWCSYQPKAIPRNIACTGGQSACRSLTVDSGGRRGPDQPGHSTQQRRQHGERRIHPRRTVSSRRTDRRR